MIGSVWLRACVWLFDVTLSVVFVFVYDTIVVEYGIVVLMILPL